MTVIASLFCALLSTATPAFSDSANSTRVPAEPLPAEVFPASSSACRKPFIANDAGALYEEFRTDAGTLAVAVCGQFQETDGGVFLTQHAFANSDLTTFKLGAYRSTLYFSKRPLTTEPALTRAVFVKLFIPRRIGPFVATRWGLAIPPGTAPASCIDTPDFNQPATVAIDASWSFYWKHFLDPAWHTCGPMTGKAALPRQLR